MEGCSLIGSIKSSAPQGLSSEVGCGLTGCDVLFRHVASSQFADSVPTFFPSSLPSNIASGPCLPNELFKKIYRKEEKKTIMLEGEKKLNDSLLSLNVSSLET